MENQCISVKVTWLCKSERKCCEAYPDNKFMAKLTTKIYAYSSHTKETAGQKTASTAFLKPILFRE